MPKIKKTRKQKILSGERYNAEVQAPMQSYSLDPHLSITPASTKNISKHSVTTQDYGYLSKDLWKTLLLTSSIIIVEILIKQFTFNH